MPLGVRIVADASGHEKLQNGPLSNIKGGKLAILQMSGQQNRR